MKKVTDRADDLTYTDAMDFKDGADKAVNTPTTPTAT